MTLISGPEEMFVGVLGNKILIFIADEHSYNPELHCDIGYSVEEYIDKLTLSNKYRYDILLEQDYNSEKIMIHKRTRNFAKRLNEQGIMSKTHYIVQNKRVNLIPIDIRYMIAPSKKILNSLYVLTTNLTDEKDIKWEEILTMVILFNDFKIEFNYNNINELFKMIVSLLDNNTYELIRTSIPPNILRKIWDENINIMINNWNYDYNESKDSKPFSIFQSLYEDDIEYEINIELIHFLPDLFAAAMIYSSNADIIICHLGSFHINNIISGLSEEMSYYKKFDTYEKERCIDINNLPKELSFLQI